MKEITISHQKRT